MNNNSNNTYTNNSKKTTIISYKYLITALRLAYLMIFLFNARNSLSIHISLFQKKFSEPIFVTLLCYYTHFQILLIEVLIKYCTKNVVGDRYCYSISFKAYLLYARCSNEIKKKTRINMKIVALRLLRQCDTYVSDCSI